MGTPSKIEFTKFHDEHALNELVYKRKLHFVSIKNKKNLYYFTVLYNFLLDSERIKRRRVDREKKFFEAETHRLKTLLTVSAGGTVTL